MSESEATTPGGIPLYVRILIGFAGGLAVGAFVANYAGLGGASEPSMGGAGGSELVLDLLYTPAQLVLRILGALAPIIVFLAVTRALVTAEIDGRMGLKLVGLLLTNTLVAIAVGLFVANVLRPGDHAQLELGTTSVERAHTDIFAQLLENIPRSVMGPFVENRVIGVVLIAVAIGLAGRRLRSPQRNGLVEAADTALEIVKTILHWVILAVPVAVFGTVAHVVGENGFQPFFALAAFVIAVIVALALQTLWYLGRIWTLTWLNPLDVMRGIRDALVMAFSTASSTATMPITYARLRDLGLREVTANLGAYVGSNFNNDGTALYEAMSALFVAQLLGQDLSIVDQLLIVVTSVVASVGAAGIPEAGLVTMTLVFTAVHLPTEYIALLLATDWFLDRCRTAINVLGDVNVACLLDGRERQAELDARTLAAVASSED